MKIRLMSDLHLSRYDEFKYRQLDEDVAIFAGDLANGPHGLRWIKEQSITVPTIFVPGNHDYYSHDFQVLNNNDFAKCKHTNVLTNNYRIIDNTIFIGATLWTDFEYFGQNDQVRAAREYERSLNDCWLISNGDRNFTAKDAFEENFKSMCYIRSVLEGKQFVSIDELSVMNKVLVSHHAAYWSPASHYINDSLTPGFAISKELSDELVSMFDVWVHGHTHTAKNYKIDNCRIICNPRGYGGEGTGFNSELIIEI